MVTSASISLVLISYINREMLKCGFYSTTDVRKPEKAGKATVNIYSLFPVQRVAKTGQSGGEEGVASNNKVQKGHSAR